ncbi:MAG TPA: aldehyde dehydrogenase family protein [Micromonosporaceae bacterium]|jgi:betaine-aldehyde dehydrogenase
MTTTEAPPAAKMYVGGRWTDAASGERLDSVDPSTERVIATIPAGGAADVQAAVDAAAEAAPRWAAVGWAARAKLLRELADRIDAVADDLARLEVRDCGNPLSGTSSDVTGAGGELRYFAGIAPGTTGTTGTGDSPTVSYTMRTPYGIVGRIIPFNHPFKFAAGKIAAPLAAGNTVILKPHEETSLTAIELAKLADGLLPPGVLSVLTGTGREVGAALVGHPAVPRIAFTGSVPTGRALLHTAADHIKHLSLELGGKNPLIVFPDVDPVAAAHAAVAGMNIARSNGQSCGSTSRIFVHREIRGPFLDALLDRVGKLRIGDPMNPDTEVGPLAFRAHYERVTNYIRIGQQEGATLAYGGYRPANLVAGYYVEPTVFTDVTDDMTIAREEIFGPVMSVFDWTDVDDVIARANGSTMALTANVWTNDISVGHRTAAALEAGYVYINGNGRRPTGMPFGGWKHSGLGKEHCIEELLSYTREKTIGITLH